MVTLIHGNDTLTSRKFFQDQKDKDSLSFDAENINLVEFAQSLSGSSLFGESKKVFIENWFSRKAKNLKEISEIINNSDNEIFLWAGKEVGVKTLDLKKIENKNFKIPQNIWNFLDSIRPNNKNNVLNFHKTLTESDPEIIFAMIVRQFRLMLGIIEASQESIDEIKRIAPWQKTKLTKQANLFGIENLKKIYKKLYKIDKNIKTGKGNLNLIQNIDILLLEI
jgi:DNA polymerase III delta subunit